MTRAGAKADRDAKTAPPIPVFDGHNDMLLRFALHKHHTPEHLFSEGDGAGHIDRGRARRGGFAGGLFAAFAPSPAMGRLSDTLRGPDYDVPLPPVLAIGPPSTQPSVSPRS